MKNIEHTSTAALMLVREGDYMVVETNFVKTPYRYESTAFFGATTFMKGPDDFRIKRGRYLDSGNPIKSDINDKSYLKYEPIGWW